VSGQSTAAKLADARRKIAELEAAPPECCAGLVARIADLAEKRNVVWWDGEQQDWRSFAWLIEEEFSNHD
jgi:hypothetical protein